MFPAASFHPAVAGLAGRHGSARFQFCKTLMKEREPGVVARGIPRGGIRDTIETMGSCPTAGHHRQPAVTHGTVARLPDAAQTESGVLLWFEEPAVRRALSQPVTTSKWGPRSGGVRACAAL
jgi:hypothetical protein